MNKDYKQNASLHHQTAWQIKGEFFSYISKTYLRDGWRSVKQPVRQSVSSCDTWLRPSS